MYLALEKGMTLHLNKLESSSPRDALCQSFVQSLVEINPVVLEKKIVKICQFIFKIPQLSISPLGRMWLFIWTNLNALHPGTLCAKFGWNWPSGSGEEDENVKSLQTYRRMDGQQVIRKAHLSFQLMWAKNVKTCTFSQL